MNKKKKLYKIAENEWFTEQAKHLRTIHFTLLVTCAVIYIYGVLANPGLYGMAAKELNKVKQVISNLKPDWYSKYRKDNRIQDYINSQPYLVINHDPSGSDYKFYVENPIGKRYFPPGWKKEYNDYSKKSAPFDTLFTYGKDDLNERNRNKFLNIDVLLLSDFKNFWNSMHHANVLYDIQNADSIAVLPAELNEYYKIITNPKLGRSDDYKILDKTNYLSDNKIKKLVVIERKSDNEYSILTSKPLPTKQQEGVRIKAVPYSNLQVVHPNQAFTFDKLLNNTNYYFPGMVKIDGTPYIFILGATVKARPEDNLLDFFLELHDLKQLKLSVGSFEEIFPNLDEATRDFQKTTIVDSETILKTVSKLSGDEISIFGIKIPQDGLRTWGMFAVLVIQLYLMLHLIEFSTRVHSNVDTWAANWIGAYQHILARFVTLITIGFIPPTLAIKMLIILWNEIPSGFFATTLLCLMPIISIYFALTSCYLFVRFFNNLEAASHDCRA